MNRPESAYWFARHAKPLQAALSLGGRILARRIELGGDEHLVARNATFTQCASNAFLVAIDLGCINMSVAELQRPAYGVDGGGALGTCHTPRPRRGIWLPSASARVRASTVLEVVGIDRCLLDNS